MRIHVLAAAAALIVLAAATCALAESPWPMYHRDLDRRGQASIPGPMFPEVKWRANLGASALVNYASPVIDSEGRVYIGTGDGVLHVVTSGGAPVWTYSTGVQLPTFDGGPNTPSAAIAPDGTVYVLDASGSLHKLNSQGQLQWVYDSPGTSADSHPAVLSGGDVIISTYQYLPPRGANAFMEQIGPEKQIRWSVANPNMGHVLSGPAVDADGNVYVAAFGRLFKYGPNGGQPLWFYDNPAHIYNTPALSPDGNVILADAQGYLLRISMASGELASEEIRFGTFSQAPPAVSAAGYVVATSWGKSGSPGVPGSAAGFAPEGGYPAWHLSLPGQGLAAAVLDSGETAFFGVQGGPVYSVERDGDVRWWVDTANDTRSTPAFDASGNLYIGMDSQSGAELVCFGAALDPEQSVGKAKTRPNGQTVSFIMKPVTYKGSGFFYVQDWLSTSGIRVASVADVTVGDIVNVGGTLGISGLERAVLNASVEKVGEGQLPVVRYMTNRAAAGGTSGPNPGPVGGVGLNTVGLVVKTSGAVSGVTASAGGYDFYISDGSVGSGIKVHSPAAPTGSFAVVTGVVTLEAGASGPTAALLVRDPSDVQ